MTNRGASVVGIDNSVELIKIAQRGFPSVEFHVMDIERDVEETGKVVGLSPIS